jgi:hypothetical protein
MSHRGRWRHLHAPISAAVRRPPWLAGGPHAQGHPLLSPPGRRLGDLRAGRTDRVQLAALRHGQRSPHTPPIGRLAAPRRGSGRRHHSVVRRNRPLQLGQRGAPPPPGEALRHHGRLPGAADPSGRPHDAADRLLPDEPRSRRRALAPLAPAQCRRAMHGGHLRQLADVRGKVYRLPERPCPGVADPGSPAHGATL